MIDFFRVPNLAVFRPFAEAVFFGDEYSDFDDENIVSWIKETTVNLVVMQYSVWSHIASG